MLVLLVAALILGRVLTWYVNKCIEQGEQAYHGRALPEEQQTKPEFWQRIYMHRRNRGLRLDLMKRVPYVLAAFFVLAVFSVPMAVQEGTGPWWVLLLLWTLDLIFSAFSLFVFVLMIFGRSE